MKIDSLIDSFLYCLCCKSFQTTNDMRPGAHLCDSCVEQVKLIEEELELTAFLSEGGGSFPVQS